MIPYWSKTSWNNFKVIQQPDWKHHNQYADVIEDLNKLPSLVFSGETRNLISAINEPETFILQVGNCAESFSDCNGPKIHDFLKIVLQMAMILEYKCHKKVIKIGRIAGQYAKPRSSEFEICGETCLPTYRGDIVNSPIRKESLRVPDPNRMREAYFRSAATLNLIRAFIQGGYADISNWEDWNNHFFGINNEKNDYYRSFINLLSDSIKSGKNKIRNGKFDQIYISHEALLLDYEEAFTRLDTTYGGYYDTSAHFLWIGERTRDINGGHVEFIRGIGNPIGIKIGPHADATEIIKLVKKINPDNSAGKVTLIIRMGKENIRIYLPNILKELQNSDLKISLVSDPMHGNTYTHGEFKVRNFKDIISELDSFFQITREYGFEPKGVHLEMTNEDVTECIGGLSGLNYSDLKHNYSSTVDPRLNAAQALELMFALCEIINKNTEAENYGK